MNTKKLLTTLTSLSLLSFISCTNLETIKPLKIQTHSAGESGFLVNSHLITGESEAILVDAQFTQSESAKVVELIKNSGKKLTTIYITHGHPDHYFGLDLVLKSFPEAKVIAKEGVVETIKSTAKGKFDYWKPLYGNDLTDKIIVPQVFEGDELELEGQKIEILTFSEGESSHDTSLFIPSIKTLISGDVIYNKVHLWLVEHHEDQWLDNLRELAKLDIENIYPGHGAVGAKVMIEENIEYIENFKKLTGKSLEDDQALMKKLYPEHKLPIILELSLK